MTCNPVLRRLSVVLSLVSLGAAQVKPNVEAPAANRSARSQLHSSPRIPAPESPVIRNAGEEEYFPVPGLLPECFAGAMQRVNRSTGGAVVLVRSQVERCLVPWHWHSSNEQITVVSGTVFIQMRNGRAFDLGPGGYAFLPARHVHLFGCSTPCVHFVQSERRFDVHYVDPVGREISITEALRLAEKDLAP